MAYSFKRSAKALAVSSGSTAVAFASNAFSPIIPFRAFGINAALIILINYILTIMVMPSVVMFYENCCKDAPCCLFICFCWCCCSSCSDRASCYNCLVSCCPACCGCKKIDKEKEETAKVDNKDE